MDPKHSSVQTITAQAGRWSVDIAAGWETGLLGRQRIGSRLCVRPAPEHLLEPKNAERLLDWLKGHDAAMTYRTRAMARQVHFAGNDKSGPVVIVRKGWSACRGNMVSQLESQGCFGDVLVFYFEGSELVRTVKCGI